MQMWSDYQKELNPNTEIYEDENGFIQFTYETDGKPRIFIDHVFLKKEKRKALQGDAIKLYWVIVYDREKELECEIIGTSVCTRSMKGAEKRLYMHFRSGWKISHLDGSVIYLYKEMPK